MSSKSVEYQAFQYSPYQTNSVILADDFRTTSTDSFPKFNKDVLRRSMQLTVTQKNVLKKAANQITAPYATNLTSKDRKRQESIRSKWAAKTLHTIEDRKRTAPASLPSAAVAPGGGAGQSTKSNTLVAAGRGSL